MKVQPSNLSKNTARISFEEGDAYDLKFEGVLAYVNPNGSSVHFTKCAPHPYFNGKYRGFDTQFGATYYEEDNNDSGTSAFVVLDTKGSTLFLSEDQALAIASAVRHLLPQEVAA